MDNSQKSEICERFFVGGMGTLIGGSMAMIGAIIGGIGTLLLSSLVIILVGFVVVLGSNYLYRRYSPEQADVIGNGENEIMSGSKGGS